MLRTVGFVACFAWAAASKVPCGSAVEEDGEETCALQVSTKAKQANIATTIATTPSPLSSMETEGMVNCGGSKAESCAQCPEGHGAVWCNGECEWVENTCQPKVLPPSCVAPDLSCVAPCPGCPELQCCPGGSCRMGVCTTSCQNEPSGSCVYAPCCPGMRCSTNNNSNYCEVCQNTPGGSCAMAPCCAGSTCSSSNYCVEGGR